MRKQPLISKNNPKKKWKKADKNAGRKKPRNLDYEVTLFCWVTFRECQVLRIRNGVKMIYM